MHHTSLCTLGARKTSTIARGAAVQQHIARCHGCKTAPPHCSSPTLRSMHTDDCGGGHASNRAISWSRQCVLSQLRTPYKLGSSPAPHTATWTHSEIDQQACWKGDRVSRTGDRVGDMVLSIVVLGWTCVAALAPCSERALKRVHINVLQQHHGRQQAVAV